MIARTDERTTHRTNSVGLQRRDRTAEIMRWGVSLAAIAALHAALAVGFLDRDDAAASNEAPEAAIMIDLPPELALPPAESVESVASSAAEEVQAPDAVEPPPPDAAEVSSELPPSETVDEIADAEEIPLDETLPEVESETLTTETPEAVEALPPEETTVAEVVLPPRLRPVEKSRPPRKEVAKPQQQPKPVEKARPTPQRQQASRAAVAGQRASGAGRPNPNALNGFMASVRADIMRQRRSVSGEGSGRTATVRFTIGASGAIGGVAVVKSSGSSELDAAAVAMVRRASPVSPIPAGVGRSSLSTRLPVQFN